MSSLNSSAILVLDCICPSASWKIMQSNGWDEPLDEMQEKQWLGVSICDQSRTCRGEMFGYFQR